MESLASISCIHYELGERYGIDQLSFLVNDYDKLSLYKLSGIENYRKYDGSVLELCHASLEKSLEMDTAHRDSIDMLLFLYENAYRDYCINTEDVNNLLLRMGLRKAFPMGISLSECGNIITGIQLASGLIHSKMAKKILVVSSDVLTQDNSRQMNPEMSVLSDAAVSCIIGVPGSGMFEINGVRNENLVSQWEVNRTKDQALYSMQKFKDIIRISKKFLYEQSLTSKEIRKILTNNYLRHITEMFVEMSGFVIHQGFYENIGRFGHTLAGDVLINLKDFIDSEEVVTGEKVFLLADSFSSCGSILMTKA